MTDTDKLLQMLMDGGMIDSVTVQKMTEDMRRKEILNKHQYSIWLDTQGYWRTYIDTPYGRKAIKRKNEKDLYDMLGKTYSEEISFKKRFDAWIERQEICGRSGNSISKYESEYRRFFEGYDFEDSPVSKITEETIMIHLRKVLKEKAIPYRALKGAFGYINAVFEKSLRDKVEGLTDNPCKYVDIEMLKSLCTEKKTKISERTYSDKELELLKDKIDNPTAHNTNQVASYACELAIYTGMRSGELSGLMWEDINYEKGFILIQRSAKYNRKTKEHYIADTKNHKVRQFPLTEEIKNTLLKVEEYEKENGYHGQFVFQDKDGRLKPSQISDSAFRKTNKSIHALRRTLNSKMKCSGVPTIVAASLLGHSEKVNDTNYTYDVLDLNLKREVVENALFSKEVIKSYQN